MTIGAMAPPHCSRHWRWLRVEWWASCIAGTEAKSSSPSCATSTRRSRSPWKSTSFSTTTAPTNRPSQELAVAIPQVPLSFHPDLQFLDELGGTLLCCLDRTPATPRHLPLRCRSGGSHTKLPRPAQSTSTAGDVSRDSFVGANTGGKVRSPPKAAVRSSRFSVPPIPKTRVPVSTQTRPETISASGYRASNQRCAKLSPCHPGGTSTGQSSRGRNSTTISPSRGRVALLLAGSEANRIATCPATTR